MVPSEEMLGDLDRLVEGVEGMLEKLDVLA